MGATLNSNRSSPRVAVDARKRDNKRESEREMKRKDERVQRQRDASRACPANVGNGRVSNEAFGENNTSFAISVITDRKEEKR